MDELFYTISNQCARHKGFISIKSPSVVIDFDGVCTENADRIKRDFFRDHGIELKTTEIYRSSILEEWKTTDLRNKLSESSLVSLYKKCVLEVGVANIYKLQPMTGLLEALLFMKSRDISIIIATARSHKTAEKDALLCWLQYYGLTKYIKLICFHAKKKANFLSLIDPLPLLFIDDRYSHLTLVNETLPGIKLVHMNSYMSVDSSGIISCTNWLDLYPWLKQNLM